MDKFDQVKEIPNTNSPDSLMSK